jgi:hypothetical protein
VKGQEAEHGLTSHFSRISGQFLRISRRVNSAGGAVSSARPLVISDLPRLVLVCRAISECDDQW